ncbi:hypothetical protein N7466_010528 [Penicillium verhagenii]|uniref:uncharacterized protein n=1 Tax=Penicillium verhagenii TaxID=1562060 RepID=UPI0025456753|nr:uncharacterized protein N7466_010528 [Penicillium verhagenii]KAJ5918536.1 hypothetical protein N7466_010528 [Penicillium verhagenii]
MDTAVSNPSVAMAQGQKQAIHPFFQQELAVSEKTGGPNASSNSIETSTDIFTLPSVQGQQDLEVHRHRKATPSPNPSQHPKEHENKNPLSPEEDLNASRRKRRKNDKTKNVEHDGSRKAGLSGWLGKDILVPEPEPPTVLTPEIATNDLPVSLALNGPQNPHTQETISAEPLALTKTLDPNRKILKLNSNGRLRSSPPQNPQTTVDQTRKAPKRGRPQKPPSKLVIIGYSVAGERNIGQLIDDILSGKHITTPRVLTPPQKLIVRPQTNVNKPTHPFFSKKPPQKTLTEVEPPISTANPRLPLKSNSSSTIEQRNFLPSASLFGRSKAKFPELVHPLWPPRELVHVRYNASHSDISTSVPTVSQHDRKKAKLPTIVINDGENATLASTALARTAGQKSLEEGFSHRPALRLPARHNASGKVLEGGIMTQLSCPLPGEPPIIHPPSIAKLRLSLHDSFSAFDSGKYESQLWPQKYAPKSAEDVLQIGREPQVLRDWLRHHKITAVDTGKSSHENKKSKSKPEKKRKKRQKAEKLDGFIVSSEEEASEMDNLSGSDDELAGGVTVSAPRTVVRSGDIGLGSENASGKAQLTNAILLSGPPGCGKTASVYAIAKELDFEVFEINPGSRRSGRDMLEKVGDMTRNHLVHLLNECDESSAKPRDIAVNEPKQNKLMGFFKGQPSKTEKQSDIRATATNEPESDQKPREQKQSLILLEEADILFEEDKQFWTGVFTLISQSRRPIIITCNNESLIPIQEMSLHAILRYQTPHPNFALDYLLLVAAHEGHCLKRKDVSKLYAGSGCDIRRALMDLNFWCQIGVGSEKAGLDWILPFWPPEKNVDREGDRIRVLSLNSYQSCMGWFNRDLFLAESPLAKEAEALRNTSQWFRLGLQDIEDASGSTNAELLSSAEFSSKSKVEQLELLIDELDYCEMRSSLDILCSGCSYNKFDDILDTSAPPMLESHRSNYVDAHPLLQSDLLPEYNALREDISTTTAALISRTFRPTDEDVESVSIDRISEGWAQIAERRQVTPSDYTGFQRVFGPIMRARHSTSTGRLAPSFENGLAAITEDLAPYIRGIMSFDGRLKTYRDSLHAIWAEEQGRGDVRARTTRASRAALEGSDKAFTRKERWFPDETNYFHVQGTGEPEWQDALFQMGHFQVMNHLQVQESLPAKVNPSTPDGV